MVLCIGPTNGARLTNKSSQCRPRHHTVRMFEADGTRTNKHHMHEQSGTSAPCSADDRVPYEWGSSSAKNFQLLKIKVNEQDGKITSSKFNIYNFFLSLVQKAHKAVTADVIPLYNYISGPDDHDQDHPHKPIQRRAREAKLVSYERATEQAPTSQRTLNEWNRTPNTTTHGQTTTKDLIEIKYRSHTANSLDPPLIR
ncbi:hypothetical protein CBL_20322 [Carabus blaptoides fortunei]